MKSTKFPPFVFGMSLLLSSFLGYSQLPRQTVILMNSKPVLVEISPQGEIIRVIKDEPAIFKDYEIKAQEIPGVFPSTDVSQENQSIAEPKPITQPLPITVKQDESIVQFDLGYATLTSKGIEILDKYILILKEKPNMFAIVRSLSLQNSLPLCKNRLNGIKTYLRLRGIDSHRIVTEPLVGTIVDPEIKIIVTEGTTQAALSQY